MKWFLVSLKKERLCFRWRIASRTCEKETSTVLQMLWKEVFYAVFSSLFYFSSSNFRRTYSPYLSIIRTRKSMHRSNSIFCCISSSRYCLFWAYFTEPAGKPHWIEIQKSHLRIAKIIRHHQGIPFRWLSGLCQSTGNPWNHLSDDCQSSASQNTF